MLIIRPNTDKIVPATAGEDFCFGDNSLCFLSSCARKSPTMDMIIGNIGVKQNTTDRIPHMKLPNELPLLRS